MASGSPDSIWWLGARPGPYRGDGCGRGLERCACGSTPSVRCLWEYNGSGPHVPAGYKDRDYSDDNAPWVGGVGGSGMRGEWARPALEHIFHLLLYSTYFLCY